MTDTPPAPDRGPTEPLFKVGDTVVKNSGDYRFLGIVVSVFTKLSGVVRYVVENDDGVLFIFNEGQVHHV